MNLYCQYALGPREVQGSDPMTLSRRGESPRKAEGTISLRLIPLIMRPQNRKFLTRHL